MSTTITPAPAKAQRIKPAPAKPAPAKPPAPAPDVQTPAPAMSAARAVVALVDGLGVKGAREVWSAPAHQRRAVALRLLAGITSAAERLQADLSRESASAGAGASMPLADFADGLICGGKGRREQARALADALRKS